MVIDDIEVIIVDNYSDDDDNCNENDDECWLSILKASTQYSMCVSLRASTTTKMSIATYLLQK